MKLKDQLNRTLQFSNSPKRIVSLVPSLTELLVSLGLEKSIVGITKFCVHPKNLKKQKVIVGGTKSINYKKIITLQPDIIICNKEENTKEIVTQCEKISQVYVTDINTITNNLDFISDLGLIFNIERNSEKLIVKFERKLNDFRSYISIKPIKKVAYFIWKDPWIVVGNSTFINEILKLNNFKNVFDTINRYPKISLDQLRNIDIDFIFLSSEPYPFKKEHIKEFQNYSSAKIILVDGEFFSWYGSRLLKALNYFKTIN